MSRKLSGSVSWRGNPARWFVRLTVKDEHGVTRRPWVDLQRPDLRNTPADKQAAKRAAMKHATKAKRAIYVGPDRANAASVTLADLEERWFKLLDADPDLKENTRARYKTSWNGTIVKQLGKRPVASLTPIVLREWVTELRAKKKASTLRNDVVALSRLFRDAIAHRWIPLTSNPVKDDLVLGRVPPMPRKRPEEIVLFKPAEVTKLLGSKLSDLHFGMLLCAFLTGMRDGELHGVRFGDLGTDDETGVRRLYVVNQVTQGHRREETPKSEAGHRRIPIHPALGTWIDWWKAEGWKAHTGGKRDPKATDYLFPAKAHRRSAELLRDLLAAADMPITFALPSGKAVNFGWHATRRTFVTMLLRAGVSAEIRDALAGHAREGVGAGHYEGALSLRRMADAIETLTIALPPRAGVVACAEESSRDSSPADDYDVSESDESREKTGSRLRDLNSRPTVYENTDETSSESASDLGNLGKTARNAATGVPSSLAESDEKRRMQTLENKGGTIGGNSSQVGTTDAVFDTVGAGERVAAVARELGLDPSDPADRLVVAALLARVKAKR